MRVCSLRAGGGRGWPVEGLSEKLEGGLRSFTSWVGERPGGGKEGTSVLTFYNSMLN